MKNENLEKVQKFIMDRGITCKAFIENDRLRLITGRFILNWRTIRELESECPFEVDDVIAHDNTIVICFIEKESN